MIKATGFIQASSSDLLVVLYGSTKAEIETVPGATIEGLPANFVISPGSIARTAEWDVGTYDVDGTWHWA